MEIRRQNTSNRICNWVRRYGIWHGPTPIHSQLAPKINAILSPNLPCVEPQTYKGTVWPPTRPGCGTRPATQHRCHSRSEGKSLWATPPGAQHGVPLGSVHPSRTCQYTIKSLNPELNPICYLLALLRAHHFLHVSRIWVKLLTFRPLMSYIYMEHPFLMFLDHTQRRSTVGRTPLDE